MKLKYGIFTLTFTISFLSFSFGINYSMEERVAYDYAYSKGITTIDNIDNANLYGNISRIELAKMISYYAINVLGKTPDTTKICEFGDISKKLDAQYFNGVTKVCQLGLMGVGIDDFYPNGKVSRAEFGTVLSRLLFNTPDGKDNYYTTHLAKLKSEGIISNDNPYFTDTRGFVMIMLMRSDKNSNYDEFEKNEKYFRVPMAIITEQNSGETITQNTPNLVYRNEIFGFQTELGPEWKGGEIWMTNPYNLELEGENIQYQIVRFGKNTKSGHVLIDGHQREHYGFTIISNTGTARIKANRTVWTSSLFEQNFKGNNNKYSFFESSAWKGNQRYLIEYFPNLNCKTWTGGIDYDINGKPYEYIQADCNGYDVINGEAIKTRRTRIEQLFPRGFEFFDVK